MRIIILNSKRYNDKSTNYGDCILIINNNEMVVYDCGSMEHAKQVICIKNKHKIDYCVGVLSHNDADHFDGFEYLVRENIISCLYSLKPMDYLDDLQKYSGKDKDKLKRLIIEKYNNICELKCVKNIYKDNKELLKNIIPGVDVVCPKYEYAIEVISKALDNNESNSIDGDSVMNAASVCLKAKRRKSILLTGDSSFQNILDNIDGLDYIQAPHHGKTEQAKALMNYYKDKNEPVYIISDNTGDSNGGSDLREFTNKEYYCTKQLDNNIDLDLGFMSTVKGCFGEIWK